MAGGTTKAVVAACVANTGLGVAKLVGFFVTGAASMMAEAVHSFADAGNQGLLLWGGARARRAEDLQRPFGYGRERYFWGFVVALVIFALGSVFALVEGYKKVQHPEPLSNPMVAVCILTVGLVLEGGSFWFAFKEAQAQRGQRGWWRFIRESKQAELLVVLLEDLGAILGLLVALAGVGLTMSTGDARFDGLSSMVLGVLLGAIAIVLALEMHSLLIGEAASDTQIHAIEGALTEADEVRKVVHMRTTHLGPDQLLVGAKVEFARGLDTASLAAAINRAEERVRNAVPQARVIYLEPDLFDPRHPDLAQPSGAPG